MFAFFLYIWPVSYISTSLLLRKWMIFLTIPSTLSTSSVSLQVEPIPPQDSLGPGKLLPEVLMRFDLLFDFLY